MLLIVVCFFLFFHERKKRETEENFSEGTAVHVVTGQSFERRIPEVGGSDRFEVT